MVDAGVVVELLTGGLDPELLGDEALAAPHLIDSEVTNVLRGLVRREQLTEQQGLQALRGFAELLIERYPADWLRRRMWDLRHYLSAYDATYVALTELSEATSLVTTDIRLSRASGIRCQIVVL